MKEILICDLCEREVSSLTKHHLIPKGVGGKDDSTILLCNSCHKQLHALYTNRELSTKLYTLSRIKNDENIKKYLKFIKDFQEDTNISIKRSKKVRKKKH